MTTYNVEWGPELGVDSVDHQLLLEASRFGDLIALDCGYGLGTPEYTETTPTKVRKWCMTRRGQMRKYEYTKRAAKITERGVDLLLPEGSYAYNAIRDIAGQDCRRSLWLKLNCPEDPTWAYAIEFVKGIVGDVKLTTAFMEGKEDATPYAASARLTYVEEHVNFYLEGFFRQQNANPLYAVTFSFRKCSNCEPNDHRRGWYGGTTEDLYYSTDAFANGTAITLPTTATSVVHGIYDDGKQVLLATSDTAAPGHILRSVDGVNFDIVFSTTTNGMYDVTFIGNEYLAVGDNGEVVHSPDGITWTAVGTLATADFKKIAYNPKNRSAYIAGNDGVNGFAYIYKNGVLVDISTDVGAASNLLLTVASLGHDHIAFGGSVGAVGQVIESSEASSGVWNAFSIGADPVAAIAGTSSRTFVFQGVVVQERAAWDEYAWNEVVLDVVPTGNFTAAANGNFATGVNDLVAVTDIGEIYRFAPTFPYAI